MVPSTVITRLRTLVLVVGPLMTLAVTPWTNFDPINLCKVLVLTSIAFAGLGLVISYSRRVVIQVGQSSIFVAFFLAAILLPVSFAEGPLVHQIWGQFGRATGGLTYISLALIFLFAALVSSAEKEFHKKLLNSLLVTQAVMTVYCIFQFAGKDPIKWSSFSIFGTLGNVNFLSGFMGITVVVSLVLATQRTLSIPLRLFLLTLSLVDIFLVAKTDSIQGLVALAVGIAMFMMFVTKRYGKVIFFTYLLLFVASFVALIFSIFDRGPLRKLVFQETVVFRADYFHAGWKMLIQHPLTGVGIDSYDDWYRVDRGVISAFRTGLNRTANTAHNIMLDLGAGGGFPLLLSYLLLLGLVLMAILKSLKSGRTGDPYFVALVCAWVAYQVQASVSINQVGVGIWGWLLGGTLIGYQRISTKQGLTEYVQGDKNVSPRSRLRKHPRNAPNTPPPLAVVLSVLGLGMGFTLGFLPFKADMDFRSAFSKGSLDGMMKATSGQAVNSFLLAQTNEAAIKNNFQEQARSINDRLISEFPRTLYGWQARMALSSLGPTSKEEAKRKIAALDPNFALCFAPDSNSAIKAKLLSLPSSKQVELVRGWRILPADFDFPQAFSLKDLDPTLLNSRLIQFCGG